MKLIHQTSKSVGNIYRLIYWKKECSRQEIADELELSLPTVTSGLNILKDKGYIYEAGNFESTGGRKPIILSCVPSVNYAIGMDITKNYLTIVIIDIELNIIDSKRIKVLFSETEKYFKLIKKEIEKLVKINNIANEKILGVGISMPVIVNSDQKTISYATVINVSENIYEKFIKYIDFKVLLFNDSNSGGLAESWCRNSEKALVYLSLSSSVGGAFFNNHEFYTGDNSRGCEFGHIVVFPNGAKCYCGKNGCLDAYCSSDKLAMFTNGNLNDFFANIENNEGLKCVFEKYLDVLAVAVGNIRMCYDCDIIIGGQVGPYMEPYLDLFKKKLIPMNSFESNADYVEICHYRVSAAAVGAAAYFIDRYIKNFNE